jgi:histone-lysine N-methyltransferase SETMAR
MQMKEKICLTGLLLATNHGCIAKNPNQSVLQCKANIPVHLQPNSSKFKVMLIMFWDSQGVLLAHFQKRGENVHSASNCKVLLKLRDAIHRKHPGQLVRKPLLHHDNERLHTATQDRVQELQLKLLEHLPYSPDLAPSNFHLFVPLKKHLGGKRFIYDKEVETRARKCLR